MTQRNPKQTTIMNRAWLPFLVALTLSLTTSGASPTDQRLRLQESVFSSFGEVKSFLREWFAKFTNNVINEVDEDSEKESRREKRDLKPPIDFEVIAQEYLRNETKEYLMQFLGYAEYLNVTNKESLDQIYQREERRLSTMSPSELLHYMTSLSKTLSSGTSGSTININGQTFDLSHVGSWCCPF